MYRLYFIDDYSCIAIVTSNHLPFDIQIVATMSPIMYSSLTFAILCWNASDVARISLIVLADLKWLTFKFAYFYVFSKNKNHVFNFIRWCQWQILRWIFVFEKKIFEMIKQKKPN